MLYVFAMVYFQKSLSNESLKEQHFIEIEIFCNIINGPTLMFDSFFAK